MTMKMEKAVRLIPNVVIGAGIILATYLDQHPLGSQGSQGSLVGALTMTSAILGADALDSLLRYGVATFSFATMLMGSGLMLAAWVLREAGALPLLIPTVGAMAWVGLQGKSKRIRKPADSCRAVKH